MTSNTDSFARIAAAAQLVGTQIEAADRFQPGQDGNLATMTSGQITGRPDVTCKGTGNVLWRSHGGVVASSRIRISGNNNIIYLGGQSRLRKSELRLRGNGCLIFFGALSTTGEVICMVRGGRSIIIGEDCMFSTGVEIETSDHHGIYDAASGARMNHEADVLIGNHVWIGRGVAVCKGASIGPNTVIGQRSVVTGKVDPGCIYAGTPARKLREGIEWSRAAARSLDATKTNAVIREMEKRRLDYQKHLADQSANPNEISVTKPVTCDHDPPSNP